jgi:hypothetical protein
MHVATTYLPPSVQLNRDFWLLERSVLSTFLTATWKFAYGTCLFRQAGVPYLNPARTVRPTLWVGARIATFI